MRNLQVEAITLKWTRKGEAITAFLRNTKSLVENYDFLKPVVG